MGKKTSGKADIKVYHVINDKNIEEGIELKQIELSKYTATGIHSYLSLYYFYPWADFKLDESFYETFSDYNEDEMPGYKLVFIDDRFHGYKFPIIPYHSNGGISIYRLIMSLNDYGRSFIDFFDYTNGNKQLTIKFD